MGMWVIWSEEHGMWWGPGEHGYTRSIIDAGRYSMERAQAIEDNANLVEFHELAMPDPIPPGGIYLEVRFGE